MENFDSDYASVIYMKADNVVLLTWKKEAHLDNYRMPTSFVLELLRKYEGSNFVVDARHGFEDDKRDVEWGFTYLLPNMSKTTCKYVCLIMNEINSIEEEMDMWTLELSKYFTVTRTTDYSSAVMILDKYKRYEKSMKQENNFYNELKENISVPKSCLTGWNELDDALDWLCHGERVILDFGCGSGTLLFLCAYRGATKLIGIDLAEEGIAYAKQRSNLMTMGNYQFQVGSIEQLKRIETASIDGIILSNILDNIFPEDSRSLIRECQRILKSEGKLLIKLNPYLTEDQIKEWEMKELAKDLYDDGCILWNRTTEEWEDELKQSFVIERSLEFIIPEADMVNRLFLLHNE